ncbi:hypothetical protein FKM82_008831 [Ascaphus truei]
MQKRGVMCSVKCNSISDADYETLKPMLGFLDIINNSTSFSHLNTLQKLDCQQIKPRNAMWLLWWHFVGLPERVVSPQMNHITCFTVAPQNLLLSQSPCTVFVDVFRLSPHPWLKPKLHLELWSFASLLWVPISCQKQFGSKCA